MPRPPLLKAESAWWVGSLALILSLAFAVRLPAATVITGDFTPAMPWDFLTTARIGVAGVGTLAVDGGSQVSSRFGYLGYNAGSTGTATISRAGSTWTNGNELYVGRSGSGALRIEAGGQVSNTSGYLGYGSGSGTATITGSGSKWINRSSLYVGRSGNGTLRVEAGGEVSNTSFGRASYIGYNAGATGTATIAGAGSTWNNAGELYLGHSGSGTLRVEAGGRVDNNLAYLGYNAGAAGTATITGAGSTWNNRSLHVGLSGSGAITVEDGGQVTAQSLFASFDDLLGDGTIVATGGAVLDADLQFDAEHPAQNVFGFGAGGTLTVTAGGGALGAGYKGDGSLTIADGTSISSGGGHLGYHPGSTGLATITGVGSKLTYGGDFYLGLSGGGALRVEAGGQVTSHGCFLGFNAGSTGTATITGAGSTLTSSSVISGLYVGLSGSGALRVEAGGQVSSSVGYLGTDYGSIGTATITGTGSAWTSSYWLYVGDSGSGALTVSAGGLVSNARAILGYGNGSMGTASVTGAGSTWATSSDLDVGRSGSGTLTITAGGLVSVRGRLTIDEIHSGDSFINLAAGGMLALWGDADDSLAHLLGLVAGTRAIRYWNADLAGWAPLSAATLGVDYTLQYQNTGALSGYTLLTVLAAGRPGDFNLDGRVDGADLLAWQRGNSPMPNSPEDLATWRANFGLSVTTPATTAVPEPDTVSLVGLASASLLLACRSTCGRMRYFTWGRRKPGREKRRQVGVR